VKKSGLVLFLMGGVAAVVFGALLPENPQNRIARTETFAKRLDNVKRIDPETARTIVDLADSMRAVGLQSDPKWEERRQLAIKQLENVFSTGSVTQQESDFSGVRKDRPLE
jgi:Ni,Fe-hydrogenase III large subunit